MSFLPNVCLRLPSIAFLAITFCGSGAAWAGPDSIFSEGFELGDCTTWSQVQNVVYLDEDGDGFTGDAMPYDACTYPDGFFAEGTGDCDDSNGAAFPGAASNNPDLCAIDLDGDGYGDDSPPAGIEAGLDCNDGQASINPAAMESCDAIDNNCNGEQDDIDPASAPLNPIQLGACSGTRQICSAGAFAADYSSVPLFGLPETPDALFLDENCDGIDGDIDSATYVSKDGVDKGDCSAMNATCATPAYAIEQAVAAVPEKPHVYIQAGAYSAPPSLSGSETEIALFGGFDTTWTRDDRSVSDHQVILTGAGSAPFVAIEIDQARLHLENLALNAVNASGEVSRGVVGSGHSSYGIVVVSSGEISATAVLFQQGNGAPGQPGADGDSVAADEALNGEVGGDATVLSAPCNNTTRGTAGAAGSGTCSQGGAGGQGGTIDTNCSIPFNFTATAGLNGSSASDSIFEDSGYRGEGGAKETVGGGGNDGTDGSNGGSGVGGSSSSISNGRWYAERGGSGGLGSNGRGGGGGGGSGGADDGTDAYGAGGGGGGAGGCRSSTPGTGGKGGGGSFGILAVGSTVTVTDSTFVRGNGGDGGDGGRPGLGQPGGTGADGGDAAGAAKDGGKGGDGGDGGHSGGGGGGRGGDSYAIYSYNSNVVTDNVTVLAGAGGDAGSGVSNSGGGSTGGTGTPGSLGSTGTCSNQSDC